jgi:hypothetical protein
LAPLMLALTVCDVIVAVLVALVAPPLLSVTVSVMV